MRLGPYMRLLKKDLRHEYLSAARGPNSRSCFSASAASPDALLQATQASLEAAQLLAGPVLIEDTVDTEGRFYSQ